MRNVAMAIAVDGGPAQFRAGMHTGMRQFVDQDEIVRANQCRNDPGIGKVAGAEHARGFGCLQSAPAVFQLDIERMIAGDQTRGAGADAISFGRCQSPPL